uniref:integral membrane protein GPR155 isoform X2 n=1 Tax=Ciona intestinalis TaxID=7719 RepID=UPI00089DB382|nr:integral membrane protein GPR155 isoform X2 [Ciona intestinalis]|eukprot:XP_018668693.1 integral membrane protein GPR155 isoform X2 [Ciona intestinalis]
MSAAGFTNLFPALVNCFVIIIFGYLAGWFNVVTPSQGKGISNFVATFALPATIFKSMVELNFATVNWSFMLACMFGKATVFILVIVLTLIMLRRNGVGRSALYAIFATQSNDFALGYPIVKVLYAKTHPELLQYIYLAAPVSLLILNPIGFIMLEIDKQWRKEDSDTNDGNELDSSPCDDCPSSESCSTVKSVEVETAITGWKLAFKIFKGVLFNPIVLMVFLGLAFHFICGGKLPYLPKQILTTLANSFSATALFYLGLSMVGKLSKQKGVNLLVPCVLIVAKILLLPILIRLFMYLFSSVLPVHVPQITNTTTNTSTSYLTTLSNFGFLYGTFPTAPSVIIYATKYGMEVDRLASGMVLCTTLSAPIMYVSAWTLSIPSMQYNFYKSQVILVDRDVSIVGIMCALWCIAVFMGTKKFRRVPHIITLFLTCSMFFMCVVAVVAMSSKSYSNTAKLICYALLFFGVKSTRLLSVSLAISLLVIKIYGEAKLWQLRWFFIFVPGLLSAGLTLVVISVSDHKVIDQVDNPVFALGFTQQIASCIVIGLCLATTIVCLVILFRLPNLFDSHKSTLSNSDSFSLSESETNDLLPQSRNERSSISNSSLSSDVKWWDLHSGDNEMVKHVVLLLLLSLSMFIGLTLTAWRVSAHNMLSGIFFEVSFLDSVFNFAFLIFIIFGIDTELIVEPFLKAWRSIFFRDNKVSLAPLSEVDKEILQQCFVFTRYHLEHCKQDIVQPHRKALQTYEDAFFGTELCTWLIEVGLALNRREAIIYGQNLMLGRVLHHISHGHYFQDKDYLYQFEKRHDKKRKRTRETGDQGSNRNQNNCESGSCRIEHHLGFEFEMYMTDADLGNWSLATPAKTTCGNTVKHKQRSRTLDDLSSRPQDTSDDMMLNLAHDTLNLLQYEQASTSRQVVHAVVQPTPKDSEILNDCFFKQVEDSKF